MLFDSFLSYVPYVADNPLLLELENLKEEEDLELLLEENDALPPIDAEADKDALAPILIEPEADKFPLKDMPEEDLFEELEEREDEPREEREDEEDLRIELELEDFDMAEIFIYYVLFHFIKNIIFKN